ncbi:MAG TPA: DinB family protein [Chitinophaga sp.]
MKKTVLLFAAIVLAAFTVNGQGLTQEERASLVKQFEDTKANLLKEVNGLSDAQMKFKPAPDRWSVADCLEHITVSEKGLFEMQQKTMKQPANPEKRKDIKVTDDTLALRIADRSKKFKAPAELHPKGTFATTAEATQAFTEQRDKIIDYVKNTNDDMRSHVADMPMGSPMDAYQILILIANHSVRHTKQLEEVKADPGFPKE